MSRGRKIVVAITGASGSIYAKRLLDYLQQIPEQYDYVDLVFSKNAKEVWRHELGGETYNDFSFKEYDSNDFYAPFASGSAGYDTMIVCPSSMGTLGRIANGISNDLITRAADVILKEGKQLVLVPRETPFNLIHLRNMTQLAEAGAVIIPAIPSFYSKPETIEQVADTVVHRILQRLGFEVDTFRWGVK
jgi:4-hydroxy-3-polyprenylbenzoate decarboxylase